MEERFGFLADWVLAQHGINTDAKSCAALLHHVDLASTDAFWFLKRAAKGDYTPDKNAERFPPLPLGTGPKLTWDTLFATWEASHKAKQGAESIRNQWRSILDNFAAFASERGKTDPSEIVSSDVRVWRDRLLQGKRSPVTVQDLYLAALRRIYAVAVSEELINRVGYPPCPPTRKEFSMRTTFLALTSATALGLLALTGVQSAAQANEGYRNYFRVEHRDHGRGLFWFHFRHHNHDRR